MKKILTLIPALMMMGGACSDDDGPVSPSDLPENDLNISVPVIPADWAPGMAYKPYTDNLPVPGVKVNVLVVGGGEAGQREMDVLNNEVWIWKFDRYSLQQVDRKENLKWCFFPNHEDIHIGITGSEADFNPNGVEADIVVAGFPVERMADAQRNMKQLEEKFTDYPLVVVAGGDNEKSIFSQVAWNFCVRIGGLDWKKDVLPNFPDWEIGKELTEEQQVYYHPGHVGAAYAVLNVDGFDRMENWIIVGRKNGGNQPGPILKNRWICAPDSFNAEDSEVKGSALGAAYVAKIAAEIKRRLPHYTNAQIADLIFTQADDLKNPEVYGYGVINPKKIWSAVENIEAQSDNEQE